MSTQKKVIRLADSGSLSEAPDSSFIITPESKRRARTLRRVAVILWILALCVQVVAILQLFRPPVKMPILVALILVDLALVGIGSLLWKKSNRLDPPSERNRFTFFMQSQLGLVTAVIAFVPLIIFLLGSKNLDKKQKGILGAIAGAALVVAGIVGYDSNPPSIEQYTEQTSKVEWLNQGQNHVYWTPSGSVYHLYDDCSYMNTSRTDQIFQGSVAQARALKKITRLCSRCEDRAIEQHALESKEDTP